MILPMRQSGATRSTRIRGPQRVCRVDEGDDRVPSEGSGEEGSALVEMALSSAVFLTALIGVFFMILAFYSYHFIADIAHEATRYASVRGTQCSINTPTLTDCPISTSLQLQNWVRSRKYPYASSLTVTVNYLQPTVSGSPATTTWSACTIAPCNVPGNTVKVVVSYAYPISIPFWRSTTINLGSTSAMVISQ